MEQEVLNMAGEKVRTMELPAEIFEAPVNVDLMHQAYVRQIANARLGTHSTKTRSETRGGGKRPWRQKGTGRARQGSIRSAQWVGGGKIHTPHPRKYDKRMPKKMRRAALRSALTVKAADLEIVLVEALSLELPKTKQMAGVIENLTGNATTLLLIPFEADFTNVKKAAQNLPSVKVLDARYLNIRDLLGHDKVLMPVEAIVTIQSYLG